MQRIKIILGVTSEGKTTELLKEFLEHFNNEELCKTVKPVFITVDEHYIGLKELAKNKLGIDVIFHNSCYEISDITKTNHEELENVFGKIIVSNLEKNDCVFYIDGIDNVIENFHEQLLFVVNSFPNETIKHSFDVVYTKEATIQKRINIESIKK